MKNFKKIVAFGSAIAMTMSIGVAAMAEVETTTAITATGDFTVSATADVVTATGTGATGGQYTVIIAEKAKADAGNLADADILYINQGTSAEEFWASMGVKNALVDTNTSDQIPTEYVVRVGGENVSVTKGEKTYSYYEAVISVLTTPESTTPTYTLGDVDGEYGINATDATIVLKHVAGISTLIGDFLLAADVDGEYGVNATDATLVLKHVAGIIDSFPAEK